MYSVDLDALPSITPDETVVVPEVCVEDEQGCFEKLQHIDPLLSLMKIMLLSVTWTLSRL